MRYYKVSLVCTFLLLLPLLAFAQEGKESKKTSEALSYSPGQQTGLQGPYLGQTPPGLKGKVFAPGIVSTPDGFEFGGTFSPDGKEFYFSRGMVIMVCRWEKKGWGINRGQTPKDYQRRLKEEGDSFQLALSETREKLALHYLKNPALSGSEISFLLGYEEPGSFFRAFQSWTGKTPQSVRTAMQSNH